MANQDLRITEVMYNAGPNGIQFIEITNTGPGIANAVEVDLGNSDFMPLGFYQVEDTNLTLATGQSLIVVPSDVTRAQFEAVYGPLQNNALFVNLAVFFRPENGGFGFEDGDFSLTLNGFDAPFIQSVYIPDIAPNTSGPLLSVSLTNDADFNSGASSGTPTPGVGNGVIIVPTDPTIFGDDGRDNLTGGAGDDNIFGGGGSDSINGGDGNDFIDGGSQGDNIVAGNGTDQVFGGFGNDSIFGGGGADFLYGGGNNDFIAGGNNNDVIFGDDGKDTLSGGAGGDEMYGGNGNDILDGNAGDDVLFGDAGSDTLNGGIGEDALYGGSQNDVLFGGDSADLLEGGAGNDVLTGGAGADQFVFIGTINNDTITDFEVGIDRIDLTFLGFFSDLAVTNAVSQSVDGAVVNLGGGNSVTLAGIDSTDLTLDDFIYFGDIYIAT